VEFYTKVNKIVLDLIMRPIRGLFEEQLSDFEGIKLERKMLAYPQHILKRPSVRREVSIQVLMIYLVMEAASEILGDFIVRPIKFDMITPLQDTTQRV
jgi:hypothetical protein